MVKFQAKNGAKAAPRARRNPRKNIQKQNQNASRARLPGRFNPSMGRSDIGAVRSFRMPSIGLPRKMALTIGWVTGTTFIGNGTNGNTNSVYFRPVSATPVLAGKVAGTAASAWMAAAPGDVALGQTYMSDIMKHYTRLVIKKARVCLVSLHPSTANDCTVQIAVARGPGPAQQGQLAALASLPVAAATADILPMAPQSRISAASYESKDLDVTAFIAGGSGARQNEFEINSDVATTSIYPGTAVPAIELEGLVPFSFIVGGTNSTAALQGVSVHDVVIEYEMELLDFIGGVALLAPVGVAEAPSSSSTCDALDENDLRQRILALRAKNAARSV